MICFFTHFHLLICLHPVLKEDPWLAEKIQCHQCILWLIMIAGGLVLFFSLCILFLLLV